MSWIFFVIRTLSLEGRQYLVDVDAFKGYRSEDFRNEKDFKNELCFCHRKITPHWPCANCEVEEFMRTLNKIMEAAQSENKVWQHEFLHF